MSEEKKVVELVPVDEQQKSELKEQMLENVEVFKKMIEDDKIVAYAVSALDENDEIFTFFATPSMLSAIGLLDVGKMQLMQNAYGDYEE